MLILRGIDPLKLVFDPEDLQVDLPTLVEIHVLLALKKWGYQQTFC